MSTPPAQKTIGVPPSVYQGNTFLSDYVALLSSIAANRAGTSRPMDVKAGEIWINTTTATAWAVNLYDGTSDILIGTVNSTTHALTLATAADKTLSNLTSTSTARTNLGLGTAAVCNTGTGSGNVPVLDANGRLASSIASTQAAKMPVRVAAATNLTLSGTQTIDGVACVAGDRVLVAGQTTVSQNGIYVVAAGAWSRATDANAAGDLVVGTQVYTQEGTTYGGLIWQVTAPTGTITPGTSSVTWSCGAKAALADGAVGSPALAFLSDITSGFYRYLANQIGVAIAGVRKVIFNIYGVLVGTTDESPNATNSVGVAIRTNGQVIANADAAAAFHCCRKTSDGNMMGLWRDAVSVATVNVASGVVTWGTFCGSHWSRFEKLPGEVLPGTVLEAIGKPVVWEDDPGYAYLSMCKISDTPGSKNVLGVFFSRDLDDTAHNDIHVASLGAYYIRMQPGQKPALGDYLESAGDGTARVQADDLLRASTIAKVTVAEPVHVYPDGSALVGCTLHCG